MKAMILAAGKGKRMRPLTNNCPKPLLEINDKALIVYIIEKLKSAEITDIVINICYLSEMIETALGDGSQYGVSIQYSKETEFLETGGGIVNALPLLCGLKNNLNKQPFILVNADIFCDFDFTCLPKELAEDTLAHLVLVDNPSHNQTGDFALEQGKVAIKQQDNNGFTFSGISVISPSLFRDRESLSNTSPRAFPLRDVLLPAIEIGKVQGEHYRGSWSDVGTPERLLQIRQQ